MSELSTGANAGTIPDGTPEDWCGYTLPPDNLPKEFSPVCCWRPIWNETGRCIWHADVKEKPVAELQAELTDNAEQLDGAILRNIVTDKLDGLSKCRLIRVDFEDVTLHEADFSEAILHKADFSDVAFPNGDFQGVDLSKANLTNAHLGGVNLNDADLYRADLTDIHLGGANLFKTDFNRANLTDANLRGANLKGANFNRSNLSNADLSEANLSNANLNRANLSNTNLCEADFHDAVLTEASLQRSFCHLGDFYNADFSGATLTEADLSEAYLVNADFVEVDLSNANLSRSNLQGNEFEETDLRGASLIGADLREISFMDTRLNATTKFGRQTVAEEEITNATGWNDMSRTYHSLKKFFSKNGLTAKARQHHLYERDARRLEARNEGGVDGWFSYLGSWASRYLTGYGVSVKQILINIFLVLMFSTLGYAFIGVQKGKASLSMEYLLYIFRGAASTDRLWQALFDSIYFSMITFTTVGYGIVGPQTQGAKIIAIFEAFLGTVLIVLLGYVLGNRELI